MRTGEADCHDQFANWPRNDRGFAWVRHKIGGRTGASAPTGGVQGVRWVIGRRGGGTPPYGGSWGENGCEKARGALGSPGRVERGSYKGE